MASTLQKLRKEAGYKTAKEFAEELEIPVATYSRYEQSPEKIPTQQAWALADKLGTSIDAVVGREHISVGEMRGELQRFYDGLSYEGRQLMDDFRQFVAFKEQQSREDRARIERVHYDKLWAQQERLFFLELDSQTTFGQALGIASVQERRKEFAKYLTEKANAKSKAEIEEACARELEKLMNEDILYATDMGGKNIKAGSTEFERKAKETVKIFRTELEASHKKRNKEVVSKILEAYDRNHVNFDYYSMDLSAME